MTLTRILDRTGTPRWHKENGKPLRRHDRLLCTCGKKQYTCADVAQVCMRCYTCRTHCKCWKP